MEVEEEVEKEVEEETSAPVRRSRRSRVSRDKQARHAALSELRSALSGKAQRIEQFELEEEEDVYDVVTEDQYKKLVNERRQGNVSISKRTNSLLLFDDACSHNIHRRTPFRILWLMMTDLGTTMTVRNIFLTENHTEEKRFRVKKLVLCLSRRSSVLESWTPREKERNRS